MSLLGFRTFTIVSAFIDLVRYMLLFYKYNIMIYRFDWLKIQGLVRREIGTTFHSFTQMDGRTASPTAVMDTFR